MARDKTANKYEDLLKSVHKGIDLDQLVHKTEQEEKVVEIADIAPVDVVADNSAAENTATKMIIRMCSLYVWISPSANRSILRQLPIAA